MKNRGRGSKAKGSNFERDCCRALSLWVSHGKATDLFWRSAMSGGRATVAHRKGVSVRQAGDITAVTPEGHSLTDMFYVECKFYKDLNLTSFFLSEKGKLAKFWAETQKQAAIYKRQPMLIAKQNGTHVLVVVSYGHLDSVIRRLKSNGPCIYGWGYEVWLLDKVLKIEYHNSV